MRWPPCSPHAEAQQLPGPVLTSVRQESHSILTPPSVLCTILITISQTRLLPQGHTASDGGDDV